MKDKPKKKLFLLVLLIASIIISTLFAGFAKNVVARTNYKRAFVNCNNPYKK